MVALVFYPVSVIIALIAVVVYLCKCRGRPPPSTPSSVTEPSHISEDTSAEKLEDGETGEPENFTPAPLKSGEPENTTATPVTVIREERPLSRAEGEEVLKKRLEKKGNLFRKLRLKPKKRTAASQDTLDLRDLREVRSALDPITPHWKALGLALGLNVATLETIQHDYLHTRDCMTTTLMLWMKWSYDITRYGLPSWKVLVAAVADPAGGDNPALAHKIAKEHNVVIDGKDDDDDDEDEVSQKLLDEVMKDGFVNVSIVKVIIVGTAGVGKTCLYYLLLSRDPPENRTSTECAQRPMRVIQVGGWDGKWKEVDLKEMLAEAVPILCKRLEKERQESDQGKGGEGDGEGSVKGDGKRAVGREAEREGTEEAKETSENPFKRAIEEVVGELTNLVTGHLAKGQQILEDIFLEKQAIYITDSGGQQAFWDLVPIFMYGPSATIFVHRLCDKFDEKPLNELYQDDKRVGPSQRATLTTAEAFQMMCQGLQLSSESKLLLVGTHKKEAKKEAKKCKETVDQKNVKIANLVPPNLKSSLVYAGKDMKKLIYEIYATERKENEIDIASNIRRKVEESGENHKVPIWWYMLQLILEEVARELGRQVFTMQECEELAERLGFKKNELEKALLFFDQLNLFFYKKDILPEVVFASSQVPLNAVTELVTKRYDLLAAKENPSKDDHTPTDAIWLEFRDQAIVTIDTLRHLQDKLQHHFKEDIFTDGIFTESNFLKLLEGLLIVAPISGSKYFCPSLLEMVDVDKLLKDDSGRVIRVVNFPTGCAPPGVFCCAVCYLRSKAEWEIRPRDIVKRNQVTFVVKGRKVTFIDKFNFFALCIDISDDDMAKDDIQECQEDCQKLNKTVFQAIEEALKTTHKETTIFGLSFLCPCTEHTTPHPATLKPSGTKLICTETREICGRPTNEQKLFLHNAGNYTTSEPAMTDLTIKVAPKVCGKLESLAYALGLEDHDIEIITHDHPKIEDQAREAFKKWKSAMTKPYTWEVLLEALKDIDLNRLARDLENWLQAASY